MYLKGVDLTWFLGPFQDLWRSSISWTFLLLAGIMCGRSRNNLRRSLRYGILALAIWLATSIAAIDTPISFGIIYCMAFSTLVVGVIEQLSKSLRAPKSPAPVMAPGAAEPHLTRVIAGPSAWITLALVCAIAFVLTLDVPRGSTIGFATWGGPALSLPRSLYGSGTLSWLGLPGPGFASGDYYPPLPYTFIYLCGACLAKLMACAHEPQWIKRLRCPALECLGRHALMLYVAHQPVVLLCLGLF